MKENLSFIKVAMLAYKLWLCQTFEPIELQKTTLFHRKRPAFGCDNDQ